MREPPSRQGHEGITTLAPVLVILGACRAGPSTAPPQHAPAQVAGEASPSARPLDLRRGLNLGNALDAPNEGEWGVVLAGSDFVAVKQAGFDHVRLPVRFSAHADATPPYQIQPAFLLRVDWAVDQALANGLAIV